MMPRGWPISHVRSSRSFAASILIFVALLLSSQLAQAQFTQQGPKLVGTGAVGNAGQGQSVALSADGNTAIVGGPSVTGIGAAWVYTRSGGVWTQQGPKLVGTGTVGSSGNQGQSVALSADGNTAIVGGPSDNFNGSNAVGAAWVFTRTGGVWTQQGSKLVGTGAVGNAQQGYSVGLSGDGNTAIMGGPNDNFDPNSGAAGAAWVFTRSNGAWTQQGPKLVGMGAVGQAQQGISVSLSGDGNTALVGGPGDTNTGAAWVYTRSGGVWTQQGPSAPARLDRTAPAKARPSRYPATVTPPSWADLVTALTLEVWGQRGSTPAATAFGPSKAVSWSAPARLEAQAKARPFPCPATATRLS
jgi:hypothetical protein